MNPGGPTTHHYIYRSNPRYVLRRVDDLDRAQRESWVGTSRSSSVAGLLFPAGDRDHGTIKALSSVTADLFEHAAAPTRLPSPLWPTLGRTHLADLVGAEVLEVHVAGGFLTGIHALAELMHDSVGPPDSHLAALSLDAIAYAESLRLRDQTVIADRLYAFHRVGIRRSWRTAAYGNSLRVTMTRAMPKRLRNDPRWSEFRHHPWRAHRRRDSQTKPERPTLKLYVSPRSDSLAGAVAVSMPIVMDAAGVIGWKVASTIETVVRPDKFVVYLESLQALEALVGELSTNLAGADVHGVPFTCDLGLDGLLSWGVDPPSSHHEPASIVDSWRTWITARLASGLVQAQRAGLVGRPAHVAALHRVQAAGIDTSTWEPTSGPTGTFDVFAA